ncbi:MAG: SufD family Fe-S cluster assembly protein [Bacilli bacterium]|jgi:Fe-S cluster assembly protein SufD|nr:SufD family Fe-S cluster assembly protein [Bacilli bacterium]
MADTSLNDSYNLVLKPSEEKHVLLDLKKGIRTFDISLEENASLDLEILNEEDFKEEGGLQGKISLAPSSRLQGTMVDFSSGNFKADISIDVNERASVSFDLAASASGKDNKVFDIKVSHPQKEGKSHVKMMGVLSSSASLVFLGSSSIAKGAKKTWTRQEGKIADLSKDGKGEVSPILRIDEDDVKASHGAALGKIPDDSLFYLMSRGLSEKEAMSLMTIGYLKPIVEEIQEESLKKRLVSFVEDGGYLK